MQYFNRLFEKKSALFLDLDSLLTAGFSPEKDSLEPDIKNAIIKIAKEGMQPLAIVTGHQIYSVDKILNIATLAISGNHGTEIRWPGSNTTQRLAPPLPNMLLLSLRSICKEFGCELEDKVETASIHATNEAAYLVAKNDLRDLLARHFRAYSLWSKGLSLHVINAAYSKATGITELLGEGGFPQHKAIYMGDTTYPGIENLELSKMITLPDEIQGLLQDRALCRPITNNLTLSLLSEHGLR